MSNPNRRKTAWTRSTANGHIVCGQCRGTTQTRVDLSHEGVDVSVQGFGNECLLDVDAIVYLRIQDGRLKLIYFPDYDSEESVTVDLENARKPEE